MKITWFLILFVAQGAFTGTYGNYFKAFPGFAVYVPINVGSLSPHEAEELALKSRQIETEKKVQENLPTLKKMIEHFQNASHPFTEFKDAADFKHTPKEQEYNVNASIKLNDNDLTLRIALQPGTTELTRNAFSNQFVFAQFFAGGIGLDPGSQFFRPATSYCWYPTDGASGGAGNAFPILRALILNQQEVKKQSRSSDSCTRASIQLLSAALNGSKPEQHLLQEILGLEPSYRKAFLLRSVDAFPQDRETLVKEWLESLKKMVEKDSETSGVFPSSQILLTSFAARLGVTAGEFSGENWLRRLRKRNFSYDELSLYFQWVRGSQVPIRSTKTIVHEALQASKNPDILGLTELALTDAQSPVPDADEIFSDLIDSPIRKNDFYYTAMAVVNTKSVLKDPTGLLIRMTKKGSVRNFGSELGKSERGLGIYNSLLKRMDQSPSGMISMLYLTDAQVLEKLDDVGAALLQAVQSNGLKDNDLIYVTQIISKQTGKPKYAKQVADAILALPEKSDSVIRAAKAIH